MKKLVLKFGKWYYFEDEMEGGTLVLDINDARIYNERQIEELDYDKEYIWKGTEIFCEETKSYIEINNRPELVEV